MFLKKKKRIYQLMNTILEMLKVIRKLDDKNDAFVDCIGAIDAITGQLEREEVAPIKTMNQLKNIKECFYKLLDNNRILDKENIKSLKKEVKVAQNILREEVKVKLNIVFLPYKVTMWDSLETIYEEALKDENCTVKVVPIPYYELSRNKKTLRYEGDKFPKNIQITHYSKYNLEEEEPDIIFVHNIYDQYNTITQVCKQYFTSNLKKYTDMLVFVPYHISSFINRKGAKYLAYNVPTIKNVSKIILSSEQVKKAATRDGIPEEKLLVLGSPKFDHIINTIKKGIEYPKEWEEKLEGKTVFTLNTGCLFFANQPYFRIGLLSDFLNIPNIVENSVLIWRPHPLTRASIKQYTPELLSYYDTLTRKYIAKDFIYKNIILDETEDYLPALMAADVLISGDGSLLRSYLATKKKILFIHGDIPKNPSFLSESLIPSDGFYYFYSKDAPWYEVVKKLAKGDDPLEENRENLVEHSYVNTDGTCGEKVYKAIKEYVLRENKFLV